MKGGIYPVKILRMFRNGHAVCEQRLMDEHVVLTDGDTIEFDNDFCDHNLNNISWFCKNMLIIQYERQPKCWILNIEFQNFTIL